MSLPKDPVGYIIEQEELYRQVAEGLDSASNQASIQVQETSAIWDAYRISPFAKKSPSIEKYSANHIMYLEIPFFIGRWHSLIRDETRTYHLKPALTFLVAFIDQMVYLKVTDQFKLPENVRDRADIIKDLSDKNNAKDAAIELLRSSVLLAKSLKESLEKEVEECRLDPVRCEKLQTISIANESRAVYSSVTVKEASSDDFDIENAGGDDEESMEEDDPEMRREREMRSDFVIACDLLGDISDESDSNSRDIPETVGDFKKLEKSVFDFAESVPEDQKLFFVESLIEQATKEQPKYFIKELAAQIRK